MSTSVLIMADDPKARDWLAARISEQPDLEVCGQTSRLDETLAAIASMRPDVAVVDIRLGKGDGSELVQRIREHNPTVRILIWSLRPDLQHARLAMQAGASGYMTWKEQANRRILDAIRRVRDGEVYLCERLIGLVLDPGGDGNRGQPDLPSGLEMLSSREREIFCLLGEGLATREIAARLYLSRHTVAAHQQRIKRKLGLRTASDLNRAATRWAIAAETPPARGEVPGTTLSEGGGPTSE